MSSITSHYLFILYRNFVLVNYTSIEGISIDIYFRTLTCLNSVSSLGENLISSEGYTCNVYEWLGEVLTSVFGVELLLLNVYIHHKRKWVVVNVKVEVSLFPTNLFMSSTEVQGLKLLEMTPSDLQDELPLSTFVSVSKLLTIHLPTYLSTYGRFLYVPTSIRVSKLLRSVRSL